jgi:hypothetical protein
MVHPPAVKAQMVLFVLAGGLCRPPAQMDTTTWKIRIFQAISNEETINMKVVDPNKLWNFVVYTFILNHIVNENHIWISQIWNSNFVNGLKWKKLPTRKL